VKPAFSPKSFDVDLAEFFRLELLLFLREVRIKSVWVRRPRIPNVVPTVQGPWKSEYLQAAQERVFVARGCNTGGIVVVDGLDRDVEMLMPFTDTVHRTLTRTWSQLVDGFGKSDGADYRPKRFQFLQFPEDDVSPVSWPFAFVATPDYLAQQEIRKDDTGLALVNDRQVNGPEKTSPESGTAN